MRDWFLQVHKLSISHADSTTRSLLTGQSVSVYEQAAQPTEVNNRPYTHSLTHPHSQRSADKQMYGRQTGRGRGRGRQRQAEAGRSRNSGAQRDTLTLARMITLIARPWLCCGAAHISATRTEPDTLTRTHSHTSDFPLTLTHTTTKHVLERQIAK